MDSKSNETTQHTPGPWAVSPHDCFAIYAGNTCNRVATATPWHDYREEAMANARLMATAPVMFAALHGAANALERIAAGLPCDVECTLAVVREAIAKARGES